VLLPRANFLRHHGPGFDLTSAGDRTPSPYLARFLELRWIARMPGTRAVRITHEGKREFERVFGLRCSELRR